VKLFNDFGDYAEFKLVPAVRHPDGSCVDESGCKWEAATSCVFARQPDQADRVTFLACMDESSSKDPDQAAAKCSTFSESEIKECSHGTEGQKLLEAASADFNAALPGSTTIPHTFIDESDVEPDYSELKKSLCKSGSAAPVCSSVKPNVI